MQSAEKAHAVEGQKSHSEWSTDFRDAGVHRWVHVYALGHWGLHASEGESRRLNLIASFIDWSDMKPEMLISKTHF